MGAIQSNTILTPLFVRWAVSDSGYLGITVTDRLGTARDDIPWTTLQRRIEDKVFPQTFADPSGYSLRLLDHHGKKNWLVRVVKDDAVFCAVWLGNNPDRGWAWDGLIHFGKPDVTPHVLSSVQLYSDESFRQVGSVVWTLDDPDRRWRIPLASRSVNSLRSSHLVGLLPHL